MKARFLLQLFLVLSFFVVLGSMKFNRDQNDKEPSSSSKKSLPLFFNKAPINSLEESQLYLEAFSFDALEKGIAELKTQFPGEYPNGEHFLITLQQLKLALERLEEGDKSGKIQLANDLKNLKREALLSNPILDFDQILLVKRKYNPTLNKEGKLIHYLINNELGIPTPHQCNSALKKTGWNNEIAMLSSLRNSPELETLIKLEDGAYLGEVDLHWDGDKFLFTKSDKDNWNIYEYSFEKTQIRKVSNMPSDVDCGDACYLPGGKIIFGSTANYQSVPCWHGKERVSLLYTMDADGSSMRQLCYDQAHTFYPSILNNGQVSFSRWDYTGISHLFFRPLMVMNPDGTGQRAVYGSNSFYPNNLHSQRPVPGHGTRLISILSGYHGVNRMGQLVLIDLNKGWREDEGIVQRISGVGAQPEVKVYDELVNDDWPKFMHPFPLNDKYFLVSCWPSLDSNWGIYLADIYDNLTLIMEVPGHALLEPIPLTARQKPPIIPDRINPEDAESTVYIHDVYAGPGLHGVPRGTVKDLRIVGYHYGFYNLAGQDKVGYNGPWDVMRILGTVPVESDGSAVFKIPANVPIAVQPMDETGQAVQLMRSWLTGMPGEMVSCIGCHESPGEAPPLKRTIASRREPHEIREWYGPARGFDFEREVQPVLDHYCVDCHDQTHRIDLRSEKHFPEYRGKQLSRLGRTRLHPDIFDQTKGFHKYTPAYDALIPYVRRVGLEDDVELLTPYEYAANTSELIQMLKKGHQGVVLNQQSIDRLVTWIDLNAPCHGSWSEMYEIPDDNHQRRMELQRAYGGPQEDPEILPETEAIVFEPIASAERVISSAGSEKSNAMIDHFETIETKSGGDEREMLVLDFGNGEKMTFVQIPAGAFIMGNRDGADSELPLSNIEVNKSFWMARFEVTNRQYALFNPDHRSKYYAKRHMRYDDKGLPLDRPDQPVVRVSWEEANGYCTWLSEKTGRKVTLPTEAQWEYACRAGTTAPMSFGTLEDDFSAYANLADASFDPRSVPPEPLGIEFLLPEGSGLTDNRYNDGAVVTGEVGSYLPNRWGIYDMHGNVAEWTRSDFVAYPYEDFDGRNDISTNDKVVRGGSFFDRSERAASGYRLAYHPWQKVFNVGFRVVIED